MDVIIPMKLLSCVLAIRIGLSSHEIQPKVYHTQCEEAVNAVNVVLLFFKECINP